MGFLNITACADYTQCRSNEEFHNRVRVVLGSATPIVFAENPNSTRSTPQSAFWEGEKEKVQEHAVFIRQPTKGGRQTLMWTGFIYSFIKKETPTHTHQKRS